MTMLVNSEDNEVTGTNLTNIKTDLMDWVSYHENELLKESLVTSTFYRQLSFSQELPGSSFIYPEALET